MAMIPYGRQHIDESDTAAVTRALESDFLTTGPAVTAFEKRLCEITGARHAIACANGTAALHLACMALDLRPGDLGVTSPLTFLASANCVEFCGGTVDFVDIGDGRLGLCPGCLEEYCRTRKPRVVIPVDYAGIPAHLPRIAALAKQHRFAVIEDAAHSLGSSYTVDGVEYQCGGCAHSDMATLSFHPVKTITTGEGGAVTTNDDALAARLRLLRSHGMTKDSAILTRNDGPWYYEMHELGYNYRITDIQCSLGLSQLDKLELFRDRRRHIVRMYNDAFAHSEQLQTPPWPEHTNPCYHLYPLRFTEGPERRRRMYDLLMNNGIGTQVHYIPVHWQPYYRGKYGFSEGAFPVAETFYNQVLSLPLYPGMTDEDVERVTAGVREGIRQGIKEAEHG
jgi:perosamine synthetase